METGINVIDTNQVLLKLALIKKPTTAKAYAARPHLSMSVTDLKASILFYSILFGEWPNKIRGDYARFEPKDIAINLSVLLLEGSSSRDGHFGVEVKNLAQVADIRKRFDAAGYPIFAEEECAVCCYAEQNKFWVTDPSGNKWEVYVITADDAEEGCGESCICYNRVTEKCAW